MTEKAKFSNNTFFTKSFTIISILILMVLSISFVSAQETFSASIVPLKNTITLDEFASYNVTITNLNESQRTFYLNLGVGENLNWILTPNYVILEGTQTTSFILKLFPKTTTAAGVYLLNLKIQGTDSEKLMELPVQLSMPGTYSGYVPNVELILETPETQDPRAELNVKVIIKNRNMLDIKNVTLNLNGELFNKEISTSLGPRKDYSTEFMVTLDPLQAPGVYKIKASIFYPQVNKYIATVENSIKIEGYSKVDVRTESSKKLFLYDHTIIVENLGNAVVTKEITAAMPWYKRVFVSSDTQYAIEKIDGKTSLVWMPQLAPLQTKKIVMTLNYRPVAIFVLILILLLILYFTLRKPVVLLKEAVVLTQDEEGISELKVRIFIKNRSRKVLENVSIADKLPGITELIESQHLGSMKPTRVTRTPKKGTLLFWDVGRLDAFEERIITYRLKAKLKIIGDMSLPRCRVKFEYTSGKEKIFVSKEPLFFNK